MLITEQLSNAGSMVAVSIDLRTTTQITRGKKSMKVARVRDLRENRADEIGARLPYMYTSLCPDERWRRQGRKVNDL